MATVGGMEDNSVQENEDLPDKTLPSLNEMCKRNGISHNCHCSEKSCRSLHAQRTKSNHLVRINGVSKITIKPSIPTLRSRGERRTLVPESARKKRRSARLEKQEGVDSLLANASLPHKVSGTDKVLFVHNNNNDSMTLGTDIGTPSNVGGAVCTVGISTSSRCGSVNATGSTCGNIGSSGVNSGFSSTLNNMCVGNSLADTSQSCTPRCGGSGGGGGALGSIASIHHTSGSVFNSISPVWNRSVSVCTSTSSVPSQDSESTRDSEQDSQHQTETTTCRWSKCGITLDVCMLMDHIHEKHVETQAQSDSEVFVCLWDGCKVYDKPSCSRSWLERHILSHSGDKPFRCIVDGCGMRFPSQSGLERHVNSHFNTYQPSNNKAPKSKDDMTPSKVLKKRKMRKKRSWLMKTDDFFDSRIMESIHHKLLQFNDKTQIDTTGSGHSVTFHSTVIARRTEESGKVKVLLHWTPEDVLPDSWVPESQAASQQTRVIPLASLPRDTVTNLDSSIYMQHRYRKHRRK